MSQTKGVNKFDCYNTKLRNDGFNRVLKEYLNLQTRYNNFSGGDSAFEYTEMANVGMLASAASVAGWSALCESQHLKPDKVDKRRHQKNGRVDLFLISNNKNNRDWLCEAKQQSVGATQLGRSWSNSFRRTMEAAREDTKNTCYIRGSQNEHGLALSFFNLYIKKRKVENCTTISSELSLFFEQDSSNYCDAWALHINEQPVDSWCENSFALGSVLIVEETK